MLKIYQTSSLDGHLHPSFYSLCYDVTNIYVDPFYSWYADLFFVNRRKNLIVSNELTKFSFLILDYRAKEELFFGETFTKYFSYAMYNNSLDPKLYINSFDEFGLNFKVNKSTLAHISSLKQEIIDPIKTFYTESILKTSFTEEGINGAGIMTAAGRNNTLTHERQPHDLLAHYNVILNERPTTYKEIKGYIAPLNYWKDELKKRKLIK